jgi:hypothetical protein
MTSPRVRSLGARGQGAGRAGWGWGRTGLLEAQLSRKSTLGSMGGPRRLLLMVRADLNYPPMPQFHLFCSILWIIGYMLRYMGGKLRFSYFLMILNPFFS